MKILLVVLALLLACGAAGSVPAATPGWPRAAAAWDRASASPPPRRGALPAARGPGASEEPANASGQRGSAGHAAGRCSSARAEAGAADGVRPFTNPPPCWRKAALVRSCVIRHWIRGGRAAQMRYFCSEKQGRSGTPAPCHSEGRDDGSQHKLAICPLWLQLPTRKSLHGNVVAPPALCFTAE